jgi:hypothetical protein
MIQITVAGYTHRFDCPDTDSDGVHRYSRCCVCPVCCDTWAEIQVEDDKLFYAATASCRSCKWHGAWFQQFPGSLLDVAGSQRIDLDLLDWLPESLARRELEIHLGEYSRVSPMLTPEELSQIDLFRHRILAGEQMPIEEVKAGIKMLRADRVAAAARAQASKARSASKVPARSAGELLGKLGIPGL